MGFNVMIPLDGTDLSESSFAVLPMLRTLGFDHVELISVWESVWDETETIPGRQAGEIGEIAQKGHSFLQAYLNSKVENLRAQGFEVETIVRTGRAAENLIEAASQTHVDLLVLATHGRTGIARWRLGSVADKVVRESPVPTLVIGPNVNVELAPYSLGRLLVPLDGTDQAEATLPLATWIARLTGAELDLVRVISLTPVTTDPSMGIYPVDLLSAMEDAGNAYLERVSGSLPADIKVKTTLLVGSAGERILDYLEERPAGLVIMSSHGRAGVLRAALGSVTDRVLHGPAPVLVLRGQGVSSRLLETARAGATPAG
jgi:nucleotide-binding universal stress UspA family protein